MIIYIIISSKVTNKSTLPLNQEGILSLHSHQHISSSLHRRVIITESQSHHHSYYHHHLIIFIIVPYCLSSKVSTKPTLFHVGCRPSPLPGLHHILSKMSLRNCPGPSLHYHDNNLHLQPSSRRIKIISFVLHKTKQQTTKASTVDPRSIKRTAQVHILCFMTLSSHHGKLLYLIYMVGIIMTQQPPVSFYVLLVNLKGLHLNNMHRGSFLFRKPSGHIMSE